MKRFAYKAFAALLVAFLFQPVPVFADLTITAGNVVAGSDAQYTEGTAGASITAGQVVYRDATDSNKFKLADSDASASTDNAVGIALHAAASGQPLKVQVGGSITIGATVTSGVIYVLSDTAGAIQAIADADSGDYTTIIGVASSASVIKMSLFVSNAQL